VDISGQGLIWNSNPAS